jgi:bacillithiol biosynthesis cysteine-adding enzyme BshC
LICTGNLPIDIHRKFVEPYFRLIVIGLCFFFFPAVDFMVLSRLSFEHTQSFTPFFLDYIAQRDSLQKFYKQFPSIGNAQQQIDTLKNFPAGHRDVLVKQLRHQYGSLEMTDAVTANLRLLGNANTFTVTTGHQLNIGTGPLYFIYKIITVINACRALKKAYPACDFVPVYWMASEDHDYEEIKSFRLYGKKYTWETNQQGAVGRFATTGLAELMDTVPGDTSLFKNAYRKNTRLAAAVRQYVNALFGSEGLVIIDGDDRALKRLFAGVMEEDVFNHSTKVLVDQTNTSLETLGYKPQIFCREINFFYLDDHTRSRIEKKGDRYIVVDTPLSFSSDEMRQLIADQPEKLSPNVILRPLYQETLLPNVAYVGGPAEVVYWLQLKKVFERARLPFPMVMPRNFALVMDAPTVRKVQKTGLAIEDFFQPLQELIRSTVHRFTVHNLSLDREREEFRSAFDKIKQRAQEIDTTLGALVEAEHARTRKSLDKIEQKLLKAEKRLQADRLQQIEAVKNHLFPGGSLQERTENFLTFYLSDPQFIPKLFQHFDPFDFRFNVLQYND